MYKKLISNKIFWLFLAAHLLLINVNYAEWGDTYRILRASEFVRNLDYPEDEKRPPLFSVLLALRPESAEQILWGRGEMLVISVAAFVLFYLLLQEFELQEKTRNLALLLFTLNPVFLYWSLRIYADVPFATLVLLFFLLLKKWQTGLDGKKLFLLGAVAGLAVLTRFEGYLLAGAFLSGLLIEKEKSSREKFKQILIFALSALIFVSPWLLYRNPLQSKYLSEPGGRAYDLQTALIYFTSLLYLFGFTSAAYFLVKKWRKAQDFLRQNKTMATFLFFELLLALLWPAAIPRLFVPVIPLLIIPLVMTIQQYFHEEHRPGLNDLLILGGLLGFYLLAQYALRLQFLILIKPLLATAVIVQFFLIGSIFFKKEALFRFLLAASLFIWSIASIWLHKDIYKAVVEANLYVVNNFQGKVAYNDVSSVSDWYLNRWHVDDKVTGTYLNMDDKEGRSYQKLAEEGIDYVIITNEHNPTLEFSADEVNYLEEIREFRYTIRGTEFFTKILKFEPNE